MKIYSREFIEDTIEVPIKKRIYVYKLKNGKVIELSGIIKLTDFDIMNLEELAKSRCTVILDDQEPDLKTRARKLTITIDNESEIVSNHILWLPESNIEKARSLFIKDRNMKILEMQSKINEYKTEIELLQKEEI